MFRKHWIAVVALGLTALLSEVGHAQSDEASGAEQQSAETEPEGNAPPLSVRVEILESETEAIARRASEQSTEQRELRELAAQEGVNEATARMANYAFWQTILIGIGTALLLYTLHLTRQANGAARQAVMVTQRIGEAQTRAYVGISDLEIRFDEDKDINIRPTFENFGQSPALNLTYSIIVRYSLKSSDSPVEVKIDEALPLGHIHARGERDDGLTHKDLNPPAEFYDAIFSDEPNDGAIEIEVCINFGDIFGNRYGTVSTFAIHPYEFRAGGDYEVTKFFFERDLMLCDEHRKASGLSRFALDPFG